MHIGLVLFNIPLSQGSGSCKYVEGLAFALRRKGHSVTIFANTSFDYKQIISLKNEKIKVIEIYTPRLFSWQNTLKKKNRDLLKQIVFSYTKIIFQEHEKKKIDILNFQHLIASPLIGITINYITDIPIIYTCHGTEIYELKNTQFIDKFKFVNNCEFIICPSSHSKKELLLLCGGYLQSQVYVISPGVNFKIFCPSKLIPISKRKTQLLFAGRIEKEKGIEKAIKVFKKLVTIKRFNHYKLIIAGEGALSDILKKKYHNLIKSGHIVFLGLIGQNKLAKLMQESRVLLFSSIWEEPFGMVIIEAMAAGIPVLANNVGMVHNLLKNSSGVLIEHNNWDQFLDKLIKLLDNPQRGDIIIRQAMRYSKRYDWDVIVEQLLFLFQKYV